MFITQKCSAVDAGIVSLLFRNCFITQNVLLVITTLSFIFVNLKSTEKRYRIKRSTSLIEKINDKKLKEKQIDIQRTKNDFRKQKLNII